MNLSSTPGNPVPDKDTATPMLTHYKSVKAAHPDALVFYRMGDFYELFYDDAIKAAEALGITLTKRGKQAGEDVPMCGVPVHSVDGYLARLIKAGFRVAVCEQMEDPAEAKKRGSKTLRRDVIRIVTPGTITEDHLLDARRNNYLSALAEAQNQLGFAWLDLSTGDFHLEAVERAGIGALLARLEPKEMLLPEKLLQATDLFEVFRDWKSALTPLPGSRFDSENARLRLQQTYGVATLDAFGTLSRAELAAAGALLDYVELTQKGKLPHLSPPRRSAGSDAMAIDASTRRSLELTQTMSGERKGSLLSVIDETVTGAGARLLAAYVAAPLTDSAAIAARLDMVSYFHGAEHLRTDLRKILQACPDLERALARLTLGRGGPRDLAGIRDGLKAADAAHALFDAATAQRLPDGVAACARALGHHEALIDRLQRALAVDLPLMARDGGFIATGYAPGLDEQRGLRDESRRVIAELEAKYRAETGVASMKIRHNNVLGFFIEVTTTHADKIKTGAGAAFIHRQTIASAARYTTVELSELDDKISRAGDRALAIELTLFADLVKEIDARATQIAATARALATLDVASAMAQLALRRRYTRPLVDDGAEFDIKGGRHPVVEALLDVPFIANACTLGPSQRVWLVTGPNMAGKSTFLRQNALIAILAQIGAFVPAEHAHIGIVDRLFSRVGAADDLARGRSTFMVEMVETASILNQAGPRALVILDEIGRGTATYDGLSIAWATLEQLHDANRCRTLFATHYHELTALAAKLPQLSCHTMRVKEWQGDVVFLHEVAAGNADRSYGIHVARLAGLPDAVISRAEQVLALLEKGEQSGSLARLADDLPLFSAARPKGGAAAARGESDLDRALAALNPDELSPKDALDALYKLRALAKKSD